MKHDPLPPPSILGYETRNPFDDAKRAFQRDISWQAMIWFICCLIIFFTIGVAFRSWLNKHDNVSKALAVGSIFIFLIPAIFISRRLHQRHGLICRTCGAHGFLSEQGQCTRCERLKAQQDRRV